MDKIIKFANMIKECDRIVFFGGAGVSTEPNKAHIALAELEQMGKLKTVITQNIDGLHQMAGSKNVIELHGTASKFYCCSCGRDADEAIEMIVNGKVPKCKECSGILKPKVVLYEEMLYDGVAENAIYRIENADMLIVGGASLAVHPAASFVRYFKGKYIVVINKSETDFDSNADIVFRDSIGEVFDKAMKYIKE